MSYVSTTRTDLDAPGFSKSELYYDTKELVVSDVEVNTTIGRFNQSLTSLQFGSTSQIIIPNDSFVYECFLHMVLPAVIANQTLPTGWCYDLIRSVEYSWGQSNVSQLRLDGYSIRHLNMTYSDVKSMTADERYIFIQMYIEELETTKRNN